MKIEFLIAYQTIVRKEFVRFARIWIQTILPSVITIFLYITIFGNFIGDRIGSISNFDYIDYIYRRLGKSINFDVSKIPIKLNHNDLSLDNILITKARL